MATIAVFWFSLDKCQVPSKAALSLALLSWTGERKYDERLEGQDKDRAITVMGKTDSSWGEKKV